MLVSRVFGVDLDESGPSQLFSDPPSIAQVTDQLLGSTVQQGQQVLDVLFGTVLLVALAVTLSYALLVYDEALATAFAW